jgi:alpha-glucoside transport system substrate-binding protein
VPQAGPDHWVDLSHYLDRADLERSFGPYLTSMLSIGDDGSWPAESGAVYGVWTTLSNKSLIWTSSAEIAADPPVTWDELLDLSDRIAAEGSAPWCFYIGDSGATPGWPATDLLETVLLRSAGPEVYDSWWRHDVPFDHPAVLEAAQQAGTLVFSPGYLDVSPRSAVQSPWHESIFKLESSPPTCSMAPGASYFSGFGERRLQPIPFPAIDPRYAASTTGAGDFVSATTDRPEVRELMRYIASLEYGRTLGARGHIPAHREFDIATISDPRERTIAEATRRALTADQFRFDASDLMPLDVGVGPFYAGMARWFQDGPDSIEVILSELEQTWQELEADADP